VIRKQIVIFPACLGPSVAPAGSFHLLQTPATHRRLHVSKERLPLVAPVHAIIHHARIMDAQLPNYGLSLGERLLGHKQNVTISLTG
jgi:hypothetical protein